MRTLKESILSDIKESVLADMETSIAKGNDDAIVSCLYGPNWEQRFAGITELKNLVESYKVKPIKQLSKLKDVNGYIVEFSHMTHDDMAYKNYNFMQFTHKTGEKCCTVRICGVKTNSPRSWFYTDWKYIKKEYDVKNGLVYIVPDELNGLFDILYKSKNGR